MAAKGIIYGPKLTRDLLKMRSEWLLGLFTPRDRGPDNPRKTRRPPNILVCLYQDIERGETKYARVLTRAESPAQLLMIEGLVTGGAFRVHWGAIPGGNPAADKTSGLINWNATSADVKAALEEIPAIAQGNELRVGLGKLTLPSGAERNPGRWTIEFVDWSPEEVETLVPFEEGSEILNGSLTNTACEDYIVRDTGGSGFVQVTCAVPIGVETPLRQGAIASCKWMHGFGYVIDAVECRIFSDEPDDGY